MNNHPITPIKLINRAVKVIKSCETLEQLICAKRYCDLIVRAYLKCGYGNGDDMIAAFKWACRAEGLENELKMVREAQLAFVK